MPPKKGAAKPAKGGKNEDGDKGNMTSTLHFRQLTFYYNLNFLFSKKVVQKKRKEGLLLK